VLYASALSDYTIGTAEPAESVAFVADHEATLFVWHLVILIGFGVALVPVVLALAARLRDRAPVLAPIATAFGLIWCGLVIAAGMIANLGLGAVVELSRNDPAAAEAVWAAVDTVQNGLGGGNELVGGIWVLLVSVAAARSNSLPRGLCVLGAIAGVAGIVTILPALEAVGAIFGLGLVALFAWLGAVLLRANRPDAHQSLVAPPIPLAR
jgi:prepilin signal peptidase PulO-like enzyme (type II secretory pathway)